MMMMIMIGDEFWHRTRLSDNFFLRKKEKEKEKEKYLFSNLAFLNDLLHVCASSAKLSLKL